MKLSTGQESTLGNYRKLTAAIFGEDSKTTKYLDDKIAEQGEDEKVIADEGQMIHVLYTIHKGE